MLKLISYSRFLSLNVECFNGDYIVSESGYDLRYAIELNGFYYELLGGQSNYLFNGNGVS